MAKNAPYGDNHRHGAVKNRTQVYKLIVAGLKYLEKIMYFELRGQD